MIIFDLGCGNQHRFEGWFGSSEEFEQQLEAKRILCPLCGSSDIVRLPHAAHIKSSTKPRLPGDPAAASARQYANIGTEVLEKLIAHIIENTEDVGAAFPEEARKIHYREAPERRIRGTASREEVEALREEGIEVVALPIPPHRAGKMH
ncbi:MAG TPA: DUF1178 family protein [Burkholderiales bacterium]|nr:DUF1178 family protein [Burkholderiales bacterium]